ncbi:hypothetical protein J4433_00740 [Candidatus Pacearchaeota archaeon]|nr:hypothetical protein [Candidatus Pacearchaeota archaeon]
MNHNKKKGVLELMLENAGKDAIKIGLMAASPIIGNLSTKLRDRIENTLGEDCYNPVISGMVSSVSNVVLYPLLTSKITHNGWLAAGAFAYALLERSIRDDKYNDSEFGFDRYPASLPGKILSLPMEYTANLYDRAKAQLK